MGSSGPEDPITKGEEGMPQKSSGFSAEPKSCPLLGCISPAERSVPVQAAWPVKAKAVAGCCCFPFKRETFLPLRISRIFNSHVLGRNVTGTAVPAAELLAAPASVQRVTSLDS